MYEKRFPLIFHEFGNQVLLIIFYNNEILKSKFKFYFLLSTMCKIGEVTNFAVDIDED